MATLKMAKYSLDMKAIRGWSPKKKRRFVMLTAILRDLSVFHKFLMCAVNRQTKYEDEVAPAADKAMMITFLTLLIGKLDEMAKFICVEKLSKDPDLTNSMKNRLKELYDLFEANGSQVRLLFEFVRSKLAFHYEHMSNIERMLEDAMDTLPSFDMFLSESDSANEIYAGTTEITAKLIIGRMRELAFQGDDRQLIIKLIDIIMESTNILRKFVSEYMTKKMLPKASINGKEVRPIKVKRLAEIDVPPLFLP